VFKAWVGALVESDMGRLMKRLSARQVANAKPPKGQDKALLCDGGGLYLQLTRSADGTISRSWVFRYQLNDCRHEMGLGPEHTIALKQARERAKALRLKLVDRVDPLESRRAEQAAQLAASLKAITFATAATSYFEQHQSKWRSARHRAQFIDSLKTYAFPVIGTIPVSEIDVALVLKVVEPIWATKQVTANRVRSRIEAVLDYCTVRGYRKGDNPARWKGFLSQALPRRPKAKHHRAMPYEEISTLAAALRSRKTTGAAALEFLLLTCTRAGEARECVWSEIDMKNATWTLPPERTKTHVEHRVPLSPRCLEILRSLPRKAGNDHVFVGADGGEISHMALQRTLQAIGHDASTTIHGFRAVFRTWCAEQTNYAREICEQALGHTISSAVERAYQRSSLFDKRRKLMEQWARFVSKPPVQKAGSNVTPLRAHV
jgi:integrase